MPDTVWVEPVCKDEKVPTPRELHVNGRSPYLKSDGEDMPDCTFLRRREREGSVFIGKDKADVAKQRAAHEAEKKAQADKRAAKARKSSESNTPKEAAKVSKASD